MVPPIKMNQGGLNTPSETRNKLRGLTRSMLKDVMWSLDIFSSSLLDILRTLHCAQI